MMAAPMNHRWLAGAVALTGLAAAAQVPFVAETTPIPTATAGDVALVWEQGRATPPLVVGCDPLQNGLYVYATDGGLLQVVPWGAMGGVDARTGLALGNAPSTLVAASASISQALVFGVPTDAGLADVTATRVAVPTPAAVAMHRSADGGLEVIADDSAGTLRRVRVEDDGTGLVQGVPTGTIALPGVPSALVVDDRSGALYAAIPAQGVFRVDLARGTVGPLVTLDGGTFGGLVGGVAFYPLYDGGGLLLTTVPPTDEVVVHAVAGQSATYVTRFRVESGARVVRAPQHIDVVANRLPGFDAGLFVIQDTAAANYKLVPWELLASSTTVPLPVEVPEDIGTLQPDAGSDGGTSDGGSTPDGGARQGQGGSAGPPARPLEPSGCGCTVVHPGYLFPGLWGLVILDAIRRRRTGAA